MKTHYLLVLLSVFYLGITASPAQKLKIGLIPVGSVDKQHLKISKRALEDFYHARVSFISRAITYDTTLTAHKTWGDKLTRIEQLNAKAVNHQLAHLENHRFDIIIGITDTALTIGKKHTGTMNIRGLASLEDPVATVSTYKLKRESSDDDKFEMNLTKVVRHEVGHLLKLTHCNASENCLMRNGMRFEETTPEFCQVCLSRIDAKYLKH